LQSELQVTPLTLSFHMPTASAPFSTTLLLTNPSLEALTWKTTLQATNWLTFSSAVTEASSGSLRYGQPARVSLLISPTHLAPGVYDSYPQIMGTRADGSSIFQSVSIELSVYMENNAHAVYLPLIAQSPSISFQWERPATGEPTFYGMTDNSSIGLTLPITFPLKGVPYTSARFYSDGFISFPGDYIGPVLPNQCLANADQPYQAIYGWWANLNPGASGGRVSTFQPAGDRFVVEFADVSSAGGVTPAYTVSFQIVLHSNGNVGLNYRSVPETQAAPPLVTIGVEARDGLFFNQVFCADEDMEVGILPKPYQSILLKPEELY
jgi:hypothetical protein